MTYGDSPTRIKMASNRNSSKVHKSKLYPDLEYTVDSLCLGYRKSAHKSGRGSLVCHGVNFVKVTVKRGEVSRPDGYSILGSQHCCWKMSVGEIHFSA